MWIAAAGPIRSWQRQSLGRSNLLLLLTRVWQLMEVLIFNSATNCNRFVSPFRSHYWDLMTLAIALHLVHECRDLSIAELASAASTLQCAESELPACLSAHANESAVGKIRIMSWWSVALTDPCPKQSVTSSGCKNLFLQISTLLRTLEYKLMRNN